MSTKQPDDSAEEIVGPLVCAYTDETGNSGLNLFDSGQPYFWTGTLLTETDLDGLPAAIHQSCLDRAGVPELHGNVLGLSGIERIASQLRKFLQRYGVHCAFTRMQKPHLACTKLADTLMDSGNNDAVSNLHYGVRLPRLLNAHTICALLDDDDREEFWNSYATTDCKAFSRVLLRLESRISTHVDDPRAHQILTDAIKWGLRHPEALLDVKRSNMDAPNVVALGLLANMLHTMHRNIGLRVKTFIHDEQNQFGKALQAAYKISSAYGSAQSPFTAITDLEAMKSFQCSMTIAKSSRSFGLQLVDVVLWLVKRYVDKPGSMEGRCRELAEYIVRECGAISDFTHNSMARDTVQQYAAVMSLPIDATRMEKAKKLLAEIEAKRLARMNGTGPAPDIADDT